MTIELSPDELHAWDLYVAGAVAKPEFTADDAVVYADEIIEARRVREAIPFMGVSAIVSAGDEVIQAVRDGGFLSSATDRLDEVLAPLRVRR
jgi:hypothetical protein